MRMSAKAEYAVRAMTQLAAVDSGALVTTELSTLDETDNADPLRRAQLWMLRQDLAGFIVLGDPAARVAAAPTPAPVQRPAPVDPASFFAGVTVKPAPAAASFFPGMTVSAPAAPSLDALERAIGQVLVDPGALAGAARQVALAPAALAELVDRYRRAGRAAIGKT